MSTILRCTDTVILKIGKLKFKLSPLTNAQKNEISNCTRISGGGNEVYDVLGAQTLYVKYALKDIEGVKDSSGADYKLSFDDNGYLTDECVSEVFTIKEKTEFILAAWNLINGIPDKITNPVDGSVLKGVKLDILPTGAGSS